MQQSKAAHGFARRTLQGGSDRVTFDLTRCDYLDSTFLGCLIDLHKQFGKSVAVAAPRSHISKLFGATKLETVLQCVDAAPACYGEPVPIAQDGEPVRDIAEHVTTCHRRLAEIDGPMQPVFARLADALEREHASR